MRISAEGRNHFALALPSAVVLLGLFVAPFGVFFVISFWRSQFFEMVPAFTVENYVEVINIYYDIILMTFSIGLAISVIATTLAFSFAYIIRFEVGRYGPLLLFVVMVTMFGGYLVKLYAWKTILGTEGILTSALIALGIINEPLTLFIYNPGAVAIALVHFLFPFAILPIYSSLRGISDATVDAARDLGANGWQVLRGIILPQCRPGLLAALVFSFIISAGDFVTPTFVGGPHPSMIGVFIHSQFVVRFNWPLGAAMAFTVLLGGAAIILVLQILVSRLKPRW